jgi:hypothetical protein
MPKRAINEGIEVLESVISQKYELPNITEFVAIRAYGNCEVLC